MERRLASHPVAAALTAYLGLSVLLTWPLLPSAGSQVPRGDLDLWQNYWNAWWWARSIQSLPTTPP